jgi:UDP-N-acetyl-D-mannosaminuronate dehydrogenase
MSLELAARLAGLGMDVRAHDPHARADDPALSQPGAPALVGLGAALRGAATVVTTTAHPEFRGIEPDAIRDAGILTVIDLVGGLDPRRDWTGVDLQGP